MLCITVIGWKTEYKQTSLRPLICKNSQISPGTFPATARLIVKNNIRKQENERN
jgi:hypothetical protein